MKKNIASQKVGCQMISATDGSAFTSTVTVYVTVDAAVQGLGATASGVCTHEGNGYHTYAPSQGETNGDLIAFTFTGTGAIPATVQIYTRPTTGLLAPTTADRTLDVSAGGEAGIDWANVGSPTTTVGLSGTTVKTATDVETDTADIQSRLPAALGANGNIKADVRDYSGTSGTFSNGRPEVNTTHAAGTAWGSGAITAAAIASDAITAAKIADGAIDAATFAAGAITASAIAADAITDAKVASDVTIASVTGAVGSVTGNVGGNVVGSVASVTARVTANTDQLAGQTVTAAAGVTFPTSVASPTNITAGTITTVTNLTNAATAGDFTSTMKTSIGTAVAASAVASVTGNVGGNVTGSVGSLATQAKADVNAEVVDALSTDTYAEPGQGTPAATLSLASKIGYLFKAWRNKSTQTSSAYNLYNDDAATVDQKATASDDGTVFTRGEVSTGP